LAKAFETFAPDYLAGKTDDEIFVEYHRVLSENYSGKDSAIWILQAELQRRSARNQVAATKRLITSSSRLETLTWILIALTLVLIIVALPPFWEAICKLLR
jgi:hypothetical protein